MLNNINYEIESGCEEKSIDDRPLTIVINITYHHDPISYHLLSIVNRPQTIVHNPSSIIHHLTDDRRQTIDDCN